MSEPIRYRSGELAGLAFPLLLLGIPAIAFAFPPVTPAAAGALIAGLAFVALAIRFWRAGVVARASGVAIRGPLVTHRLRWDEIARFSLRKPSPGSHPKGMVELRDGTAIWIWAIRVSHAYLRPQAPYDRDPGPPLAEELIGRLNARLDASRAA